MSFVFLLPFSDWSGDQAPFATLVPEVTADVLSSGSSTRLAWDLLWELPAFLFTASSGGWAPVPPWPWGSYRRRFNKFCIPSGFETEQGRPRLWRLKNNQIFIGIWAGVQGWEGQTPNQPMISRAEDFTYRVWASQGISGFICTKQKWKAWAGRGQHNEHTGQIALGSGVFSDIFSPCPPALLCPEANPPVSPKEYL